MATREQVVKAEAQVKAMAQMVLALADAIREARLIPSGHLYAMTMSVLSLDEYMSLIQVLKDAKVVEESNHLLVWVGPQKATESELN
jgi:hypothetical protein